MTTPAFNRNGASACENAIAVSSARNAKHAWAHTNHCALMPPVNTAHPTRNEKTTATTIVANRIAPRIKLAAAEQADEGGDHDRERQEGRQLEQPRPDPAYGVHGVRSGAAGTERRARKEQPAGQPVDNEFEGGNDDQKRRQVSGAGAPHGGFHRERRIILMLSRVKALRDSVDANPEDRTPMTVETFGVGSLPTTCANIGSWKPVVSVTARKIRNHGRERASLGVGRTYAGYLISYPSVGRGMVIFRDPNGHRMVTTPVRRVLGDAGGDQIYVETENSVYLLTFRAEPLREMPHALAAVTSSRQRKG